MLKETACSTVLKEMHNTESGDVCLDERVSVGLFKEYI